MCLQAIRRQVVPSSLSRWLPQFSAKSLDHAPANWKRDATGRSAKSEDLRPPVGSPDPRFPPLQTAATRPVQLPLSAMPGCQSMGGPANRLEGHHPLTFNIYNPLMPVKRPMSAAQRKQKSTFEDERWVTSYSEAFSSARKTP